MTERLKRLGAQSESLHTLLLRAYAKFLFFRPMALNTKLIDRISAEERGVGFEQLRNWLYWDFIQELVKICADKNPRTPSIRNIRAALCDAQVVAELRRKYTQRTPPPSPPDLDEQLRRIGEQERRELEVEFDEEMRVFLADSQALLTSATLTGYVKIRHKLIAHNELRQGGGRYDFFDLRVLKLKYGQERELLEKTRAVVDAIESLVRNCFFVWESFVDRQVRDVCEFWQIDSLEG